MSLGTPANKDDWGCARFPGELILLRADLERRFDRLDSKIDRVVADLRVGMADMEGSIGRTIWMAVGALGAVGILLRFF